MKSTGCGARRLHIKVAAVLGIALILNALYAEQLPAFQVPLKKLAL
jgi:hypothetical protein